jgi:hypothetical protein
LRILNQVAAKKGKPMLLTRFAEILEWIEEKTRPLFIIVALLLYVVSLLQLATEVSIVTQLDEFLVQALINLSIPFGIILLQEMLELVSSISHSNLKSASRQFEIVVLVIVRSFFKNFAKLNAEVDGGSFGTPVQEALVKVLAIMVMIALILLFNRLSERRSMRQYSEAGHSINLWKQLVVVILSVYVLLSMLINTGKFEEFEFISLVFTGLIVIDAIFLLVAILQSHEFDSLAFESGLVISLIFARFPLFTSNTLSYSLSAIGVTFATALLYLFYRSRQMQLADEAA